MIAMAWRVAFGITAALLGIYLCIAFVQADLWWMSGVFTTWTASDRFGLLYLVLVVAIGGGALSVALSTLRSKQ